MKTRMVTEGNINVLTQVNFAPFPWRNVNKITKSRYIAQKGKCASK